MSDLTPRYRIDRNAIRHAFEGTKNPDVLTDRYIKVAVNDWLVPDDSLQQIADAWRQISQLTTSAYIVEWHPDFAALLDGLVSDE